MTICPDCRGVESVWLHRGTGRCTACHGAGSTLVDDRLDDFYLQPEECWKCSGRGSCPTCLGKGLIEDDADALWDSGCCF